MKKEEFPTFLDEQPTVVFGRTTRELLVMLIGLALGYVVWANAGLIIQGPDAGAIVLKGLFACIPVIGGMITAFVNIGSRPLEEWALVAIFYYFTPKLFLYIPQEEDEASIAAMQQYRRAGVQDNAEELELE